MSVKLSNSGEAYNKRVNKTAIKNIAQNAKNSFFKFVINSDMSDEIKDIVNETTLPIYCMPLGETKSELEKNAIFTFEFCLKHNYFYSDRIHIRLFSKKRGI